MSTHSNVPNNVTIRKHFNRVCFSRRNFFLPLSVELCEPIECTAGKFLIQLFINDLGSSLTNLSQKILGVVSKVGISLWLKISGDFYFSIIIMLWKKSLTHWLYSCYLYQKLYLVQSQISCFSTLLILNVGQWNQLLSFVDMKCCVQMLVFHGFEFSKLELFGKLFPFNPLWVIMWGRRVKNISVVNSTLNFCTKCS